MPGRVLEGDSQGDVPDGIEVLGGGRLPFADMTDTGKSRADLIAELKQQPKPDLGPPARSSAPSSSGSDLSKLAQRLPTAEHYQYAIVNVGTFNSADRMRATLAQAGAAGWELITVYDKASNWVGGWEKGFMLLKRVVPEGVDPGEWCIVIRN